MGPHWGSETWAGQTLGCLQPQRERPTAEQGFTLEGHPWGSVTREAPFCRHIDGSLNLVATPRVPPAASPYSELSYVMPNLGNSSSRTHICKPLERPSLGAMSGEEGVDVSQGHFRGDTGSFQNPRAGKVLKYPSSPFQTYPIRNASSLWKSQAI